MPLGKDKDATIVVKDTPDQEKYEFLKEKIRYKQALRENSKKIDHQKVRLNIQADALPSKTFFIMNALAAVIAGYGLLSNSAAVVIGAMLLSAPGSLTRGTAVATLVGGAVMLELSRADRFASAALILLAVGFAYFINRRPVVPTEMEEVESESEMVESEEVD